jgi:hypothetical protein
VPLGRLNPFGVMFGSIGRAQNGRGGMQCAQFRSPQSHSLLCSCRALARTPMAHGARATACQAAGAIAGSTRLNNARRT